MIKATIISTIFAATAFQVTAEPSKKYDLSILPADVAARVIHLQQYGDRFETAIEATLAEWENPTWADVNTEYDMSILPPDVAQHVAELQEYGDRFELAIRAIFAEAMKPTWGFEDCGHEAADFVDAAPES
ncbi:MAG: hypothetical protein JXR14_00970 [Paracoccaceae bacterium]